MIFVEESNPSDLLLKSILCPAPTGVSPFMQKSVVPACKYSYVHVYLYIYNLNHISTNALLYIYN